MTAATGSEFEELRDAVAQLTQQVRVLTQAVDELADELQWRNRNVRGPEERPAVRPLTWMPADPADPNWHVQWGRTLAAPAPSPEPSSRPSREPGEMGTQQALFE